MSNAGMLTKELPHAGSDGIQAEVGAREQIQEDHFSAELLREDMLRDRDAAFPRHRPTIT